MEFLRLYLGEITGLVLVVVVVFVAGAVAPRYFPDRRKVRLIRNACVAAALVAFVLSLVPSITVNQTPRGQIDRAGVDQDQTAFEQKHADQTK